MEGRLCHSTWRSMDWNARISELVRSRCLATRSVCRRRKQPERKAMMKVKRSSLKKWQVHTLKKGEPMKGKLLISVLCLTTMSAFAAKHSDFSGPWQFAPEKSKNIGMMAQMKMIETVEQSDASLDVTTHTTFQGRDEDSKTHLDLTGKPATNESPMGGPSETVSKWDGGKLITTWTSESAVA